MTSHPTLATADGFENTFLSCRKERNQAEAPGFIIPYSVEEAPTVPLK